MERHCIFMDLETQYCEGVSSSHLGLKIQCSRNKNTRVDETTGHSHAISNPDTGLSKKSFQLDHRSKCKTQYKTYRR
jgi:hypothetical protein